MPLIPLLDVAANVGGVAPAQKGAILIKVGVNTGLDNITPVLSCVVQPFIKNSNSLYTPAFSPVIRTWPAPFATILTGPTVTPSSE